MIRLATMSSVCPDWTIEETIASMKRHGYAGYEPRVEWGHRAGIELTLAPAERAALRKRFQEEDLVFCCLATGLKFAMQDPSERARQREALRRYIDLAGDLGCERLRIFGGAIPGSELSGVVRYVAEAIRPVLADAQSRKVRVLLETHDDWCRSAQVRAVVRELNHPAFGALWDLMHTQRFLETPEESFATFGTYVGHLHVHDGRYSADRLTLETVALGEGVIDHAGPLRLLQQAGFDGFASLEVIHKVGANAPAEAVLKQYADGLKKMVR